MDSDAKWTVGLLAPIILAAAGYIAYRLDSLDARLRTVAQVQAQHSLKLDQLLAAEDAPEILALPSTT